jgi:hypothetical protein
MTQYLAMSGFITGFIEGFLVSTIFWILAVIAIQWVINRVPRPRRTSGGFPSTH